MKRFFQRSLTVRFCAAVVALGLAGPGSAHSQAAPPGRAVGTIKNIQAGSFTLTSDAGGDVTAKLAGSTKILQVPPGEKDLKNATPLQAQDLQPGDRVLVRGQASTDGHSIAALSVIVMKQSDVSAKREHDREDWQKRGVGGLVSTVDVATGTITVSSAGPAGNHDVVVRATKDTALRRYVQDSVRFDEARPAPLEEIKPGDQLRARGARSADGGTLTAEEVVSGTFRNIAGTITAIDPASSSMTVQDAISKGPVVVKVSPDSQMKKLPPEMAQRIAIQLKGGTGESGDGSAAPRTGSAAGGSPSGSGQSPRGPAGAQDGRGNGVPDLQRLLSRLPGSTLADLQKGDAVMIVATPSGSSGAVSAITLLAGVEPILAAGANRGAAMMLSPWTLGASGGEAEAAP